MTPENRRALERTARLYERAIRDDSPLTTDERATAALRGMSMWMSLGAPERAMAMGTGALRSAPKVAIGRTAALIGQEKLAVAKIHASMFAFVESARGFEDVLRDARLPLDARREATRGALAGYAALGARDALAVIVSVATKLPVAEEERAQWEYALASYDFDRWRPGASSAENAKAHATALYALSAFYDTHKGRPASASLALEAAWRIATLRRAADDPQQRRALEQTVAAWQFMLANGPATPRGRLALESPWREYGAEAEFLIIDDELERGFDYASRRSVYAGHPADVVFGKTGLDGAYGADTKAAIAYDRRLEHVAQTYLSPAFTSVARARMGSLHDTLRTGLFYCARACIDAHPIPIAILYGPNPPPFVPPRWMRFRDAEIDAQDALMVGEYAGALTLAASMNVSHPTLTRARARLAYFTELIGDTMLRRYVTATTHPANPNQTLAYQDGMYAMPMLAVDVAASGSSVMPVPDPRFGP